MLRRVKPLFLIDTDTASDDAVALIMALRSPDVRVLAITTVAGNVAVQQPTRNALYTAELCGSNVPIFMGAAEPLNRPHQTAHWFHGRDGLGDHGYPSPKKSHEKLPALEAIISTIESNPGLVLVTLGPLTNVALALELNPGIAGKVSRCVIMGGAPCCEGNVTPAAEYNIWCDPEAARIVLRSGLPVELVGWHLCRGDAVLNPDDIRHVLQIGTQQSEHYVDVEASSELTLGMTVVDRLNVAGNDRNRGVWEPILSRGRKAKVYWTIDNERWKQALYSALK